MMQAVVCEGSLSDPQMLFTRYSDGARPVKLFTDSKSTRSWELAAHDGGPPKLFTSSTDLMVALTGHPRGRHWSPERYFGIGTYADPHAGSLFDLFPAEPMQAVVTPLALLRQSPITVAPLKRRLVSPGQANVFDIFGLPTPALRTSTDVTVVKSRRRPRTSRRKARLAVVDVSGPVGIDLVNRSGEVAKLLYSCFGRRIASAGYEGEDVLQEVYRGLLARNKGKCPWDPAKSSFGHYVYMVCSCVLSNYHRKQKRRRVFEQTGMLGYQASGDFGYGDVAANMSLPADETNVQGAMLLMEAQNDLVDFMLRSARGDSTDAKLAVDVLPYVREGIARVAVAEHLHVSMAAVSRAISFLRAQSRAWKASLA